MLAKFFTISIMAILIENYIFVKFLGICPFLGVSKRTDTALGMGLAVIFTMTLSSAITWLVYNYILFPHLTYLKTIAFILIIASLVQFIELFLKKAVPALYKALGIYLPLITTNCAVLGSALLSIQKGHSFMEDVVFGFSSAVGFTLALILFSFVRQRIEEADILPAFRGLPITLVAAALLSMAFMGFQGLKLPF